MPQRQTSSERQRMLDQLREITECAQDTLARAGSGWFPQSDITVGLGGSLPLTLVHMGFKRISVAVNPKRLANSCQNHPNGENAVEALAIGKQMVRSTVMLWAGHYEWCPWDLWRHQRLCVAAAAGAFGTARITQREWTRASEIAAFFERNIVASILTEREGRDFVEGLVWEHIINGYPPNLLTSLFFRMQSLLAPRSWNEAIGQDRVPIDPLADMLVAEVSERVFDIRVRVAGGRSRVLGVGRHIPSCGDWPKRVMRLARYLIRYLYELPNQQPPSPFGELQLSQSAARQLINMIGENGAEETAPPGAHGVLGAANSPGQTPGATGSGGLVPSRDATRFHRTDFAQLDRHYSSRARVVAVEADSGEASPRTPDLLAVGYLDSEPCSLAALATGQIDWFRTGSSGITSGEPPGPQLYRRSEPLEISLDGDIPGDLGVPHLLLIVDSSGSMGFNPRVPAGAGRGPYDVVLMACYGIFKHIEACGLGNEVQVACINFSNQSILSEWRPFSEIEEVKRVLIGHQGGGTVLSPAAIRRAFETRPGRFLAVTITDGCLANVPAAVTEFQKLVDDGCGLALLHVGEPNDFTRAVEAMDCTVHLLQNVEALTDLTLRIAREAYLPTGT